MRENMVPSQRIPLVLHVVPCLARGGMELALARVSRALKDRGFPRHSVVCLKGEASIASEFDQDVLIHCVHSHTHDLMLPLRLHRVLRDLRPSIIHARNWGAWPDVAMARLIGHHRVPLVFSFHGARHTVRWPLRRRLACKLLSRVTARTFAVSAAGRRVLVENAGLSAERVAVIPNGVDAQRFYPAETRLRGKPLTIGAVGTLDAIKNHALLVRTCADLVKEGLGLELRIAGEGPKRQRLETLISDLGLDASVRLYGQVDNVPEFLRELDIFVLPSRTEDHPNALLEGMACALPCIATAVGGTPDTLEEGRSGILVPEGCRESLGAAIRVVATNESRRRALGDAARSRVLSHFSLERMADAYAELYGGLLNRRS